jgi:hypothetical protein
MRTIAMMYDSRVGLLRSTVSTFAALVLLTQSVGAQDDEEPIPDEGATQAVAPGGVLYATFDVVTEPLTIALSDPAAREKAIALFHGAATGGIPIGKLICEPADYNAPWSFHVDPGTLRFSSGAIELCDAKPSYINENCAAFGKGTYCPWGAKLIELRECPDAVTPVADCPLVP